MRRHRCPTIPPCNKYGCNSQYQYVQQSDVQGYWNMAKQYVLADHFFSSQLDGSFEGHQYLIAGQAETTWGIPTQGSDLGLRRRHDRYARAAEHVDEAGHDDDERRSRPASTRRSRRPKDETLADELDAKKLTWRYYAPGMGANPGYIWSAYDAINHIRNGPEWTTNVISPASQFIVDVGAGKLANVTWITPTLAELRPSGQRSDDAARPGSRALVDAVGNEPVLGQQRDLRHLGRLGRLYDSVPPPLLDYDGLGMRVPLIVISPYALKNKVTKKQYEFGSILKFVEKTFGLKPLAASDTRAAELRDGRFQLQAEAARVRPVLERADRAYFLSPAEPEPAARQRRTVATKPQRTASAREQEPYAWRSRPRGIRDNPGAGAVPAGCCDRPSRRRET